MIKDYKKIPEFLRELGFDACTFNYPLAALQSSYLSFSDSGLVRYTLEELSEVYERIMSLRDNPHCPVINPTASLRDMQRHTRGEPEQFPCLGGFKYFYLDWRLRLYRCHYWETPMVTIGKHRCATFAIGIRRRSFVMDAPAV